VAILAAAVAGTVALMHQIEMGAVGHVAATQDLAALAQEQLPARQWDYYHSCARCHYPSSDPIPSSALVNGPRPSTPLGDLLVDSDWQIANGVVGTVGGLFTIGGAPGLLAPASLPAPNFVTTSGGDTIVIPEGAQGPFPTQNGGGVRYEGGSGGNGLHPSVTSVRIMDPTDQYPSGYVNYYKMLEEGGYQTLNPFTGQSITKSNPWWHIPLSKPQ
jgi:hypothetical protein